MRNSHNRLANSPRLHRYHLASPRSEPMTHYHEAHPHYEVVQAEHAKMIREMIKANQLEQRRVALEIFRNVAGETRQRSEVKYTQHQLDTTEKWLGLATHRKTRSKGSNGRMVQRQALRYQRYSSS